MKASQNQLEDLLQLSGLDQAIRVNVATANQIVANLKAVDASPNLLDASAAVLNATNDLENLQSEMNRIDADLKVVEGRIQKDRERLENSSNTKDIQGLQSELELLSKRKSELEDGELEIMEQISAAEKVVVTAKTSRAEIELALHAERTSLLEQLAALQSTVEELKQKRQALSGQIPAELTEIYTQKSARGIAIGRLAGRECGACRMALTASNFDEISRAVADELVYCPECQAILVR